MPLTRRSKIKEVWKHPVGHAMLLNYLRQQGKSEKWIQGLLISNLQLYTFDRIAGAGFCDMVLEMASHAPDTSTEGISEKSVWWKEAAIYQVYLPSFMDSDHDGVGDLGGVIQRLPYLSHLGVDAIWLWPLLCHDENGNVSDYTEIAPDAGTMQQFEELVRLAHARDIKIILGLEIAATSDKHPWFVSALEKKEDAGYYVLKAGTADTLPNNWTGPGGRPAWKWFGDAGTWGLQLGERHKMDLDWDNAAVRREIMGVLRFWQMAGADGFVLGPVHTLNKKSFEDGGQATMGTFGGLGYEKFAHGPRLHRYLKEIRTALPVSLLIGEVQGANSEVSKLFASEDRGELDMVLDTSPMGAHGRGRADDSRVDLNDLKEYYIKCMEQYGTQQWMPLQLETWQTPRIVSRLGASPLYRSILSKMLGMLLLTLRGTPMLYQGQELGLPNTRFASHEELRDPASLRLFREMCDKYGEVPAFQKVLGCACEHARTPMPWSEGPAAGFTGAQPWIRLNDDAARLNASVQMEDAGSVWHFYKRLLALRRESLCLVYGSFKPVFVKNKKVFCYFRIHDGNKWYVEINLTERQVTRPGRITLAQKLEISNYDSPAKTLRPYEANLYRCE